MKTAFDYKQNRWLTETTDRLPKHDLFFGSNYSDSGCGILLGDGAMGTNIWPDRDRLHLDIGHSDIWDDSTWEPDGVFCSGEDDNLTTRRTAGKIDIDFDFPVFDMMFQEEHQARLSLADATAKFHAVTPFSSLDGECFAESVSGVSVLHLKGSFTEETSPSVILSRWGSRTIWRWYSMQKSDVTSGTSGTSSFTGSKQNRGYIVQVLNGTIFCLGLDIQTDEPVSCERLHSRAVKITLPKQNDHDFTVYYTVAFGENEDEAVKACDKALDAAVASGREKLHERHTASWKEFWNRFGIRISDDYLENIYYMNFYFLNCECRGKWAPHFENGIWGRYYDFLPWVYYFHYNMQHFYHAVGAVGHTELEDNYFRMRHDGMDNYRRFTREIKGVDRGIFVHDVTDRHGKGATYDYDNVAPGPQIAMAMWKHYRYTGDEEFLKNIALPMMCETADYYLAILQKGNDGRYHTFNTTAYEGHNKSTDAITDRVMIEALFRTLVSLPDVPNKAEYEEVLAHLTDFIKVKPCPDEVDADGYLTGGLGKGEKLLGNGDILAFTYQPDDNVDTQSFCGEKTELGTPCRKMFHQRSRGCYGFPDVEISPVFPGSIVGLSDRNDEIYTLMYNQALMHECLGNCTMWCMSTIYLARLGMKKFLLPAIRNAISGFQAYPNGMGQECNPGPRSCAGYYDNVHLTGTDKSVYIYKKDFAHFDFETVPIVSEALTESLFQSFEGVLRICPTYPVDDEPVFFDLHAEGGFRVTAEVGKDNYLITVDSLRNEEGLVVLPDWFDPNNAFVYYTDGEGFERYCPEIRQKKADRVIVLSAKQGRRYLISSVPAEETDAEAVPAEAPNMQPKQCGNAILGAYSNK